jgi:hypothetical protein
MPFGGGPFGSMSFAEAFGYIVPASETEEGKKRLQAYYEALGRFVDMFARVETAIALTLWMYAKTKPQIAKIIFAGARIDTSSTYIKQLAEATSAPQELRDDLVDVLQQVGIINHVRNYVLHYGATSVAEGNAIVSDVLKAKGQPTEFPISPTALDNMTTDLRKITFHLNYRHLGRPVPRGELGRDALGNVLLSPWQYKHPAPPKARTVPAKYRRSHKRGPKPSRQPGTSPT